MRYRYLMYGSFTPNEYKYKYTNTDHDMLSIEIPAPFSHDTEKEAMQDGHLAYRFISLNKEVVIAVYANEGFTVNADTKGRKYLKTWVEGEMICSYTYAQFKAMGGRIYEIPNSIMCCLPDDLDENEALEKIEEWDSKTGTVPVNLQDYETDTTFTELFPMLTERDKAVYIDNEAYAIIAEM